MKSSFAYLQTLNFLQVELDPSQRQRIMVRSPDWEIEAQDYLRQGDYAKAESLYEQGIQVEPQRATYYWYLGLALLLQGQETDAQATWLVPIIDAEPEAIAASTADLIQVLRTVAQQQQTGSRPEIARLLYNYAQELNPDDLNTLLQIWQLSLSQGDFSWELPEVQKTLSLLKSGACTDIDFVLLHQLLPQSLEYDLLAEEAYQLAEACLQYAEHLPQLHLFLRNAAINIGFGHIKFRLSIKYAELCLNLPEPEPELFKLLSSLYQPIGEYGRSVSMAKRYQDMVQDLSVRTIANAHLLQTLLAAGGNWQEASQTLQHQIELVTELVQSRPTDLTRALVQDLSVIAYSPPHLDDNPATHKPLMNQLADLCQANIETHAHDRVHQYRHKLQQRSASSLERPLKIGYLSNNLRTHAVGLLSWGLYEYCDHQSFQIYTYFTGRDLAGVDSWRNWYIEKSDQVFNADLDGFALADQINRDEIDLLMDLDSSTQGINCAVLALKPAPIQATWLGFDASGIPAVDYFIADPYVLPDNAQEYYAETIWRLPQTYLAVDGFYVGLPTLRRSDLNIPNDAVVYLSQQRGHKRHPHTTHLQLQILKAVPNSYLLIKGYADSESIQQFFLEIAEQEGVSGDRLKFLPSTATDDEHRANLKIADVVLDTYPYNGATTTLETLWMEIPVVTKVGQQFAARNSYTFLVNADVSEGIAWTDDEYVEWGIRLGQDESLRQQVVWKLKVAKQTAPLWNARQFTQQMETAYCQMWMQQKPHQ
jgi:predicted O-linked N-acetylglucosamine transferase (SPINDLY family)